MKIETTHEIEERERLIRDAVAKMARLEMIAVDVLSVLASARMELNDCIHRLEQRRG